MKKIIAMLIGICMVMCCMNLPAGAAAPPKAAEGAAERVLVQDFPPTSFRTFKRGGEVSLYDTDSMNAAETFLTFDLSELLEKNPEIVKAELLLGIYTGPMRMAVFQSTDGQYHGEELPEDGFPDGVAETEHLKFAYSARPNGEDHSGFLKEIEIVNRRTLGSAYSQLFFVPLDDFMVQDTVALHLCKTQGKSKFYTIYKRETKIYDGVGFVEPEQKYGEFIGGTQLRITYLDPCYQITADGKQYSADYNDKITVTSDDAEFSYWMKNGHFVSRDRSYTFFACEDAEIQEVTADDRYANCKYAMYSIIRSPDDSTGQYTDVITEYWSDDGLTQRDLYARAPGEIQWYGVKASIVDPERYTYQAKLHITGGSALQIQNRIGNDGGTVRSWDLINGMIEPGRYHWNDVED